MSNKEAGLIKDQITSFEQLFDAYRLLKPRLNEINQYEAGYFNVFNILKLDYSEVRAHTPITAHLLNPKGSHAQGDLFYKLFIDMVMNDDLFNDYDADLVYVKDEHPTIFGQMDVFIEHRSLKNPYAIIIENKINAGDQKDQLLRYKRYLDSLDYIDASARRMLYLRLR